MNLANKSLEDTKRISFDREQRAEITNTTEQIIYDEEELITSFERIYTVISVCDENNAPSKIRFGTGDKSKLKWHEEEPSPVANVYYHTEREHHCRQHNIGAISVLAASQGDKIVVIWEGYDKRIRER